jgi:5-dehydro-2-deoxygluconokinase
MNHIGFDQPLYLLPFDHRGPFQAQMFGWRGILPLERFGQIASAKRVIYDGFKAALGYGVPKEKAGILVDEHFGAAILRDASAQGYATCCPAELSGQDEFDFEFGEEFDEHIERFRPTFCKVLVHYNPEADRAFNFRQLIRLMRLSQYLHRKSRSMFMFELSVPPLPKQLQRVQEDQRVYDLELRPELLAQAIGELQNAGIEPDVWKIEGLERREDFRAMVAAARRGPERKNVGCMLLGRSEDDVQIRTWLTEASSVPGIIGFALDRTCFREPLTNLRQAKISREEAVDSIARRFSQFAIAFERNASLAA